MANPQRYFINLTIHDLEAMEDLVHVAFESTMLDELAATLRSQEINLLKIAKKRDNGRYKIIYKKKA